MSKPVLAVDLGTQLGWALLRADGRIESGSESLHPTKMEGRGARYLKLSRFLSDRKKANPDLDTVYFEDIEMHAGTIAAHVYGGFLAILEVFAEVNRVKLKGYGFGPIKKSWTGVGNCEKESMIAAAVAKGFKPRDDNEADALAILHLGASLKSTPFLAPKKAKKPKPGKPASLQNTKDGLPF